MPVVRINHVDRSPCFGNLQTGFLSPDGSMFVSSQHYNMTAYEMADLIEGQREAGMELKQITIMRNMKSDAVVAVHLIFVDVE